MPARAALLAALCLAAAGCATMPTPPRPESVAVRQAQDPYFRAAAERIAAAPAPAKRARNVILFIGDGMGVATVTAARIFAGQQKGVDGESYTLAMDTFPRTALSRTYSHDFQVSDSAATATAMTSGVKTRSGVLNLTSEAQSRRCLGSHGKETTTLFQLAEGKGLATGIVSTARITHATPAAAYAVAANRNWENDAETARAGAAACADIARQLIEWPAGDGFEIALGGGRANFLPQSAADPEHEGQKGLRADGRDLAGEWAARSGGVYLWNAQQFSAHDFSTPAKVLGLFSPSHMAYEADRARDPAGEPSLAEMTAAAIKRLSQDADGYVLMVEGGRIDHAHHGGEARRALTDTVAFDDAIRAALDLTSRDDTLILVTADHSHVLSIAGYPARNNPILGLVQGPDSGEGAGAIADDGKPYTTLGYMNGPGSIFARGATPTERPDLTNVDTTALGFRQPALVPLGSETHAGEDVAIYAWGPGDDVVGGVWEQNVIFHALARALGWKPQ